MVPPFGGVLGRADAESLRKIHARITPCILNHDKNKPIEIQAFLILEKRGKKEGPTCLTQNVGQAGKA
ncbi:MAG: hypothetical protein ACOZBW_12735 [Thermodesulfobacteriota bacterium]